jgi:hypothetical protein
MIYKELCLIKCDCALRYGVVVYPAISSTEIFGNYPLAASESAKELIGLCFSMMELLECSVVYVYLQYTHVLGIYCHAQ